MFRAQVKDSLRPENVMKLRVQGLGLVRRGCVDDSLQCIQARPNPTSREISETFTSFTTSFATLVSVM